MRRTELTWSLCVLAIAFSIWAAWAHWYRGPAIQLLTDGGGCISFDVKSGAGWFKPVANSPQTRVTVQTIKQDVLAPKLEVALQEKTQRMPLGFKFVLEPQFGLGEPRSYMAPLGFLAYGLPSVWQAQRVQDAGALSCVGK